MNTLMHTPKKQLNNIDLYTCLIKFFTFIIICSPLGLLGQTTFTVSTTNDNGAGSLRDAITQANATANTTGVDVIEFSVSGTVTLASVLPAITEGVNINGKTAPGYVAGTPSFIIHSDHNNFFSANGPSDITIQGLGITETDDNSGRHAISFLNVTGCLIQDNSFSHKAICVGFTSGDDLTIINNDFDDCGLNNNQFVFQIGSLAGVASNRLNISGNTFTNCRDGFSFSGMDNLQIDNTLTGSTEVHIPAGMMANFSGVAINLSGCNNLVLDNIDLSHTTGTISGFGLISNACNNLTIRNLNLQERADALRILNSNTLLVEDNTFENTTGIGSSEAIEINGGSDVQVLDNTIINYGMNNNTYAINIQNLVDDGFGSRLIVNGNTFTSGRNVISLVGMDGLVIDDVMTTTPGQGVHLPTANGRLNWYGTVLSLSGMANVTIDGFDLSYTGGTVSGEGLLTSNCPNLTVTNNTINDRITGMRIVNSTTALIEDNVIANLLASASAGRGIWVDGGSNIQVLDNTLTDMGMPNNTYALTINNISDDGMGNQLIVNGTTFNGGRNSVGLSNLSGVPIDNVLTTTPGQGVHLPDADGRKGMNGTNLSLSGISNVTLNNFDLSYDPAGTTGQGLSMVNCNSVTVQNFTINKRSAAISSTGGSGITIQGNTVDNVEGANVTNGIFINGGTNYQVLNNTIDDYGRNSNTYGLRINNVADDGIGNRLLVNGNNFVAGRNAVSLESMDGLVVDNVASTAQGVHLPDGDGRQAWTGTNLNLASMHNVTINGFDLSYTGVGNGERGVVSVNSNNLTLSNLIIDKRNSGIFVQNSGGATITSNVISNGINNSGIEVFSGNNILVQNNSVSGQTSPNNVAAYRYRQIADDGMGNRLMALDNAFSNNSHDVIVENMDNVIISDGSIMGSEIILKAADNYGTSGSATALRVNNGDNIQVSNLTYEGFDPVGSTGVYLSNCTSSSIKNVSVSNRATGVFIDRNAGNTVEECLLQNNNRGIELSAAGATPTTYTVTNCNFSCNNEAVRANQYTTVNASNNFWGQADGSSTDSGSGDIYTLVGSAPNTGIVNGSTTFLTAEHASSSITTAMANIQGNGNDIDNGQTTTSTSDDTDFGGALLNNTINKTFTVQNLGTETLNISSITSSETQFVISGAPTTVAGGMSETFNVAYTPDSDMTFTATITVSTDDCYNEMYTFNVTGSVSPPPCDLALSAPTINDETCIDADDGQIVVNATCSTCTSIEYSLDNMDFSNTNGIFSGLMPGTYTIYVRDSGDNSCTDSSTGHEVAAGSVVTTTTTDDSGSTTEDMASGEIDILSNDTDTDCTDDDRYVLILNNGSKGEAVVNANNTLTYTPNMDEAGCDVIEYAYVDPISSLVANNDIAITPLNTLVSINVLGNDFDPQSDPLTPSLILNATNGNAVLNGSNFDYTPTMGFVGTDEFIYEVTDGNGNTDQAIVQVVVGNDETGKLHYLPEKLNSTNHSSNPVALWLSTEGPGNATVTITSNAGYSNTVTVTPTATYTESFGTQFSYVNGPLNLVDFNTISNNGFKIASDIPVNVQLIQNGGNGRSFLNSKSVQALGTRFRVAQMYKGGSSSYESGAGSIINVMASEDNTQVTFDVPPGATWNWKGTTSTSVTVTLDEGESYMVGTDVIANDMNGALVTSTKPIVAACGTFGMAPSTDNGWDQLVPEELTGTDHVVVRTPGNLDEIYIIATEDNTSVDINGSNVATLNMGQRHTYVQTGQAVNTVNTINTDKPVYVWQNATDKAGSPENGFALISPIDLDGKGTYRFRTPWNEDLTVPVLILTASSAVSTMTVENLTDGTNETFTATNIASRPDLKLVIMNLDRQKEFKVSTNAFVQIMMRFGVLQGGAISYIAGFQATTFTSIPDQVLAVVDNDITFNPLANDTDPAGGTISIVNFTQPSNGTVVDNMDGTFTYTPANGYSGADGFSYTISNGNGLFSTASVTFDVQPLSVGKVNIDIAPVADDPGVTAGDVMGVTDAAIALNITFTGSTDTDGSESIDNVVIGGVPGTVTLSAGVDNMDGTWTLTEAQAATVTATGTAAGTFNLTATANVIDEVNDCSSALVSDSEGFSDPFVLTIALTCDISISSIVPTNETCPSANDGIITVTANCTSCTTIEYAISEINGGVYQSSNVFPNLSDGSYTVLVRDSGNVMCNDSGNATVAAGSDTTDPVISCPSSETVATETGVCTNDYNYSVTATDNCSGIVPATPAGTIALGVHNGNYYYASTVLATYAQAQAAATAAGGYLATINDAAENTFIHNNRPNQNVFYWLGFNDITTEGTFVWDNGEAVAYTNWAPFQPDNNFMGQEQDAGAMDTTSDQWDDQNVNETYNYIIELPGSQLTVELTSGLASGASFPVGNNVVEWTATDETGNTAVCSFTITVEDNMAPSITAPANITVDADENCEYTSIVDLGMATVSDNCTATANLTVINSLYSLADNEFNGTFGTLTGCDRRDLNVALSNYNYESGCVTDCNNPATCYSLITPGYYAVVNQQTGIAANPTTTMWTFPGHTSGTPDDAYLAVNGSTVQETFYSQVLNLQGGIEYEISFWATTAENIALSGAPELEARVIDQSNSQVVSSVSTGAMTVQGWNEYQTTFTPSSTGNYSFEIRNLSVQAGGNDFAIDDISLKDNTDNLALGVNTVIWTVTDEAGNTNTAQQTVTVEDNTDPVAMCNDITINLVNQNTYTLDQTQIDMIAAGSTDNCSTPTYEITNGQISYNCSDVGSSYTVTMTATDGNNNTDDCSAMVTITDTNNVCCDISISSVVPTDEVCPGGNDGTITVTSVCNSCTNGATDIEYSLDGTVWVDNGGVFTGLMPGMYTVQVRDKNNVNCNATAGSSVTIGVGSNPTVTIGAASCSYTLHMRDLNGNNWQGGFLEISIDGGAPQTYTFSFGNVTDMVPIPVSNGGTMDVTFTGGNWTWEVSYWITDDQGAVVLGVPNQANYPATGPAPGNVSCQPGTPCVEPTINTVCNGVIVEPDLCADAGTQTGLSGGLPVGGVYSGTGVTDDGNGTSFTYDPSLGAVGANTFTYTYTDGNGCSSSANGTIDIFALPTAGLTNDSPACPGSTVVFTATGGTMYEFFNDLDGDDEIDMGESLQAQSATATYSADGLSNGDEIHVMVWDANGCIDVASSTATLEDTQPPVIGTMAMNMTVDCDGAGNTTDLQSWLDSYGGATATDNCDGSGSSGSTSVLNFAGGSQKDYIVADATNLPSGTNALITMEAVIRTPMSSQGSLGNIVSIGNTASSQRFSMAVRDGQLQFVGQSNDGSSGVSISDNNWYHVAITYDGTTDELKYYVDGVNVSTATHTLNTADAQKIYISRRLETDFEYFQGEMAYVRIWDNVRSATDVSDNQYAVINSDPNLVAAYYFTDLGTPNGDNTAITTITDASGNGNDGTVTSFDYLTNTSATASNWVGPNGLTPLSGVGGVAWTNDYTSLSDLCGETGVATVTFTATDAAGNTAETTATFTIEDMTGPAITGSLTAANVNGCDANTLAAETTLAGLLGLPGDLAVTDGCSSSTNLTVTHSDSDMGTNPIVVTRMYTITDECNKTNTVVHTINISDTEDPVAVCPTNTVTVTLDGTGNGTIVADALAGGNSTDNCAGLVESSPATAVDCSNIGTPVSVILTATDANNNTSTISCDVTVQDGSGPVISCNDITVNLDASGSYMLSSSDEAALINGSTDNCSTEANLSVSVTPSAFDCNDVAGTANNYALAFDETNSEYVVSSSNVGISGNAARTLEFWIRMDETDVFNEHIINWGASSTGNAFGFYQTFNSELKFYTNNNPGGYDFNTGFFFDQQQWYHVAATYDGNTTVKFYVNGIPTANATFTVPSVPNTTDSPLYLAVREDLASSTHSTIDLDEVRIWDFERTQAEILADYNVALNGNEPGLVLYYDMEDNGPGTTVVVDKGPNGNNGTLTNMDANTDWINSGSPVFSGGTAVTLQVTDEAGVTSTSTCAVTVTVQSNVSLTTNVTNESCMGAADGSIEVTINGGTGPYSYTLTNQGDGSESTVSGASPQTFANVAPGNYIVEVEDNGGCMGTTVATVSGSMAPCCDIVIDSVVPSDEVCPSANDGSITVTASCTTCTSIEYAIAEINGGVYQSSNVFPNLADGNYTVLVRDNGNAMCNDSENTTVAAGSDTTDPVISCPSSETVATETGVCTNDYTYLVTATDNCSGIVPTTPSGTTALGVHNGNYYYASTVLATYAQAQAAATAAGGYLVTINDAAENTFIHNNRPNQNVFYWLGFNDITTEGTFVWDNGEAVSYTNWATGQPDNNFMGQEQDAGAMDTTSDQWDDQNVNETYNYIIELPGSPLTVELTSGLASGASFPVGNNVVEWTATDESGNTAVCSFTITVEDNMAPSITAPANITVDADENCEYINIVDLGMATVSDNCTATASLTVINSLYSLADNEFNGTFGTLTGCDRRDLNVALSNYNYESGCVTDCNNPATCYSLITPGYYAVVNQQTGIAANPTTTMWTFPGHTSGTPDDAYLAVNGSTVQETFYSQVLNLQGGVEYEISFWATTAENIALSGAPELEARVIDQSNSQVVSSVSTGAMTVQGWNEYQTTFTPSSTGNYSFEIRNLSVQAGGNDFAIDDISLKDNSDNLALGINTVIWTVTDEAGNTDTAQQTVTVEDNTNPVAMCNNITINLVDQNTYTLAQSQIDMIAAGSTDNCSTPTYEIANGQISYNCSDVGSSYTVTMTATDGNNNTDDCTAMVTITDTNSVCCDITIGSITPTDESCMGANDGSITIVATCNSCAANTDIRYSIDGNDFSNTTGVFNGLGAASYTIAVRDVNNTTCSDTGNADVLTSSDTTPPIANCQDISLDLTGTGSVMVDPALINNNSTDDCAAVLDLSVSPSSFDCSDVGVVTGCGTYSLDFDGSNDYALTQDNISHAGNFTYEAWVYVTSFNNVFDFQGIVTTATGGSNNHLVQMSVSTNGKLLGEIKGPNGNNTRKIYEADEVIANGWHHVALTFDGNNFLLYVDAVQQITNNIDDDNVGTLYVNKPLLFGAERELNSNGYTDLTIDEIRVWDITRTQAEIAADMFNCLNGNESGLLGYWPIETGQGVILSDLTSEGNDAEMINMESNDWQAAAPALQSTSTQQVILTVTDAGNNSNTCAANVTINDTQLPDALCQNFTVHLDNDGMANVDPTSVDNGSSDNCGLSVLALSPREFDCTELGANTVTLTVGDNNGNTNTCTAEVTVEVGMIPQPVCSDVMIAIEIDGTGNGTLAADALANGNNFDLCGNAAIQTSPMTTFTCAELGEQIVTLTASDAAGNTATVDCTVFVTDTTDPTLVCPADITVSADAGACAATGVSLGTPTFSDNCTVLNPYFDGEVSPYQYIVGTYYGLTGIRQDGTKGTIATLYGTTGVVLINSTTAMVSSTSGIVYKVDLTDGTYEVFSYPGYCMLGIDWDGGQYLYVTDYYYGIIQVDVNTGDFTRLNIGNSPTDVAVVSPNIIIYSESDFDRIVRYNVSNQTSVELTLNRPGGLFIEDASNLVAVSGGDVVRLNLSNGSVTPLFTFTNNSYPFAMGVTKDGLGNFYVASAYENIVYKYDGSTVEEFTTDLFYPFSIVLGNTNLFPLGENFVEWTVRDINSNETTCIQKITVLDNGGSCNNLAQVLDFDGTGDYVDLGSFDPHGTNGFTQEAWVYAQNIGPDNWSNSVIMQEGPGSNNTSTILRVGQNGSNNVRASYHYNGGLYDLNGTITEDNWHHLAMTYDGTTFKLYVDGIEVDQISAPNPVQASTGKVLIGDSEKVPGRLFDGRIDEVRIWDYARSASEIQSNLERELNGTESGLIAYYNFNQGNAFGLNTNETVLLDATGNHNGTLVDFALTPGDNSNWIEPGPALGKPVSPGFITTWEVTAADLTITIPTYGGGYSYLVDWGDGTEDVDAETSISHTYSEPGIYTVSIEGDFPRFFMNFNNPDAQQLISMDQWGNIEWNTLESMFLGCSNMVYNATDAPNLTNTTRLIALFRGCSSLGSPDLNNWDVSTITDAWGVFMESNFNGQVDQWDVSNVNRFTAMFASSEFNQDISSWNVSSGTDFSFMFERSAFNQPLANWERTGSTVSGAASFRYMFRENTVFDQDISNWNMSGAQNLEYMFRGSIFNQSLNTWDVSNVVDFDAMFEQSQFNQELNGWNTSSATSMASMFSTSAFNQPLSNWDVSNVAQFQGMFIFAEDFDQDLSAWQITSAANMIAMLNNSGLSVENYDATLISWASQNTLNGVRLGASGLDYCAGEESRMSMINNKGWNILGDEKDNGCPIGPPAEALCFDGIDDQVIVPYSPILDLGQNFTVETWFKPEGTNTGFRALLDKRDNNTNISNLSLAVVNGTDASFYIGDNSGSDHITNIVAGVFTPGQWHHYAVTYDGNDLKQYVDGTLVATTTANVSYTNQEVPLVIGNLSTTGIEDFSGQMDEVRIWNTVLSGVQIESQRGLDLVGNEIGLVHYYKFNQGVSLSNNPTVTSVTDELGNMDGILNGFDLAGTCSNWSFPGPTLSMNRPFVTTWDPGSDNTVNIPTNPSFSYNYTVDWGDGVIETGVTGDISHTYSTTGNKVVKISGQFPQIYLNGDYVTRYEIREINQWGDVVWESMEFMFWDCYFMEYKALDSPNLTNVTSLEGTFAGCYSFEGNLSNWEMSTITNTAWMFSCTKFNGNVSTWDMSNVTNMQGMFSYSQFDSDVNMWDVSKVTNMNYMFLVSPFNKPLNEWDVSSVESMEYMFAYNFDFDSDISTWDVSNVTSFYAMFYETHFNQPINAWVPSSATNMGYMFAHAYSFNQPIEFWDVSNVQQMDGMFYLASDFNQPLNNWDVSNALYLNYMFYNASSFDQELPDWIFNQSAQMYGMFFNNAISVQNYDNTLIGWAGNLQMPNNLYVDVFNLKYCAAETARNFIIAEKGWTLYGDGPDGNCATACLCDPDISPLIPNTAGGMHNAAIKCDDGQYTHYCDNLGRLLLSLDSQTAASVEPSDVNVKITPGTRYYEPLCEGSGGTQDGSCFIANPEGAIILCRTWDVNSTATDAKVRYYFDDTDIGIVNQAIFDLGLSPLDELEQMWFYKVKNGEGHAKPEDLTLGDIDIIDNDGSGIATTTNWVLGNTGMGDHFAEYVVSSFSGGGGGGAQEGSSPVCPSITGTLSGEVVVDNPQNVQFTIDIDGGTGPYMVVLSDGTSTNNFTSGGTITVAATETASYTIRTIVDANDCPQSSVEGMANVYFRDPTDDTPPIVQCNDYTVSLDTFGLATISIDSIDGGSFDNEGVASTVLSLYDLSCEDGGEVIVTMTVTDMSGNTQSCDATVTVEDPTSACCPGERNITATITGVKVYNGDVINSDATIDNDSNNNTNVRFEAVNAINLGAGFEVKQGAVFEALISPCDWP